MRATRRIVVVCMLAMLMLAVGYAAGVADGLVQCERFEAE